MIVEVYPYNGRTDRIKHYSDSGYYILQRDTYVEYEEAIDVYPTQHTYVETDHKIETPEELENNIE